MRETSIDEQGFRIQTNLKQTHKAICNAEKNVHTHVRVSLL